MECKDTRRPVTCGVYCTYYEVCVSGDVFYNLWLGSFVDPTSLVCVFCTCVLMWLSVTSVCP